MQKYSLKLKILFLTFFMSSCGTDMVEDVIDIFPSGNKKVYVRFHSDANVLEKHFYNDAGEMVYLERDSLSYGADFKEFMIGNWIIDKMTVNDEIIFKKDSIINLDSLPNVYSFSSKKLTVIGPQYNANYTIQYLDSSTVAFEGSWMYGKEGEDTYRSERFYDVDYFQILSYYTFLWTEFLEDEEKEEEVIFRRVDLPTFSTSVDSILLD